MTRWVEGSCREREPFLIKETLTSLIFDKVFHAEKLSIICVDKWAADFNLLHVRLEVNGTDHPKGFIGFNGKRREYLSILHIFSPVEQVSISTNFFLSFRWKENKTS